MEHHYNLIAVIDRSGERMLFCRRRKPPYAGLLNFVGGKIESGEDAPDSAYRELFEETAIPPDAIALMPLMAMDYPLEGTRMEVFAGRLNRDVAVSGDENELLWLPAHQDYADARRFAGVGNLGHIVAYIRRYTTLFENQVSM